LEPLIKANYKLKTLDFKDFIDKTSYYDQLNFEYKLKGGAGRGQVNYLKFFLFLIKFYFQISFIVN
jgi:hypothetical protein